MSAREDLIYRITRHCSDETAQQMVDAHRTEVLAKAIGRMRAIPVDCTALTGPVWYGDGWNSAIRVLEDIADYQTPDDEAYPGELQRLRALALALRVAALRKEDLAEAQRVLVAHADFEINAREEATAAAATATPEPDFFVADRTYLNPKTGNRFHCRHLDTDPLNGRREAWGWLHRPDGTRRRDFFWADDYPHWTPADGGDR